MHTRPEYESARDRELEMEVAEAFAAKFNLKAVKLPSKYPADYGLMKGDRLQYALEIKMRSKLYPTMMLSLAKCQALREFASWGVETRVVFAVPQGIYVQRIHADLTLDGGRFLIKDGGYGGGYIGIGGRTDRGDSQDTEPCVFWDSSKMQMVGHSNPLWFKDGVK